MATAELSPKSSLNASLGAVVLAIAAALSLQQYLRKLLELSPPYGVSPMATLALFAFTLIHGRARLGGRRLGVLMLSTFTVTFAMEAISIATGLVGDYTYTDALGPKLLGVPLLIPAAWLMMLYPTLLTVETMLNSPPVRRIRDESSLGRAIAWCALLSLIVGFAMTAWDIGVETIIVITGEYTWRVPGGYFGVPIPNFVGWVATSFAAAFAFLLWELTAPPRPAPDARAPEWQPVSAYFAVFIVTAFGNFAHGNKAAVLVTVFVMAPYVLIAATRMLRPTLTGPWAR